jgi:UDP-GlcNAc:undecaprenyl-phosphate GlcNAc-1-phosphate transferase
VVFSSLVVAGVLAFALSVAFTAVMRRVALGAGVVAVPKADRWHRERIPLLGGVGIAGSVLVAALAAGVRDPAILILLAGGITLGLVGLADDLSPLKPQTKLLAQILVAATLASLGLQLRLTGLPVFDLLLTLLWIVGITNAVNLLDNMDGLAAGIAAIAVSFRLAFLIVDGNVEGATFAAVVLGALVGFLIFNFHPASIFMGDAGSLFVGTLVAGLSLVGGWPYSRGIASVLLFPVLLLLVPIFDTVFVTVARTLARRPISQGGRDHTSHRLVALGLSERRAVLLLYAVAVVSGGVAFVSYRHGLAYFVSLVGVLAIGVALLGVHLGRLKVYPEAAAATAEDQDKRFVSFIADFSYKRQIAAVIIDLMLVVLAYYTAYVLRFEDQLRAEQGLFVQSLPIVIVCQMTAFGLFRVYQGLWRYTGIRDLLRLAQAVTLGTTAVVVVILFMYRFIGYSRAVFVIDWMVLLALTGMARLSFRALEELLTPETAEAAPVIIYGAGNGGTMVLREIRNNRALGLRVAAFLDDDRAKARTTIGGVPVLGGIERLEDAITKFGPTRVIVSTDQLPEALTARLSGLCAARGVTLSRATIRFE